ncbi:MAG: hypothetical protein RL693_266 [Verrucomicrobiota bacterium]|jgi:hypothetical protein
MTPFTASLNKKMTTLCIFIELGILWFLITLFTDSTNAEQSYRETSIVIFGVMTIGVFFKLLLGDTPLVIPVQLAALYYLVDWSCGCDRRITWKICGWYLLTSLTIRVAIYSLTQGA